MGLFSLSGCVASLGAGPDYGYYPPAQPYYGYERGYYAAPSSVIMVPRSGSYRPAYRPRYNEGSRYGGGGRGYNDGQSGSRGHGGGRHGRD